MGDEQARVVSASTLDPHTAPPSPIVVGAVNRDYDVLAVGGDQAGIESSGPGLVIDESMCGVNSLVILCAPSIKVGLFHDCQSITHTLRCIPRDILTTKNSNLSKKFVEL